MSLLEQIHRAQHMHWLAARRPTKIVFNWHDWMAFRQQVTGPDCGDVMRTPPTHRGFDVEVQPLAEFSTVEGVDAKGVTKITVRRETLTPFRAR